MATKTNTTTKKNTTKKNTGAGAFVPVNLKDIQFVNKPTKASKKK